MQRSMQRMNFYLDTRDIFRNLQYQRGAATVQTLADMQALQGWNEWQTGQRANNLREQNCRAISFFALRSHVSLLLACCLFACLFACLFLPALQILSLRTTAVLLSPVVSTSLHLRSDPFAGLLLQGRMGGLRYQGDSSGVDDERFVSGSSKRDARQCTLRPDDCLTGAFHLDRSGRV